MVTPTCSSFQLNVHKILYNFYSFFLSPSLLCHKFPHKPYSGDQYDNTCSVDIATLFNLIENEIVYIIISLQGAYKKIRRVINFDTQISVTYIK